MAAGRSVLYESCLVVMAMAVTLSTGHTLSNGVPVAVCGMCLLQGVSPGYTYDETALEKLHFVDDSDVQIAKRRHVRDVIETTTASLNTTTTPAPKKIKNLSLIVGGGAVAFIVLLILIVAIYANRRASSPSDQRNRNDSAANRQRSQRPPEAKTESGERVFQINLAFDHVNADGDRVVVADGNNMYSVTSSNTPVPNR